MTPAAIVEALQARGASIRDDGPDVVVRPGSALTPDLETAIRGAKPELLVLLRERHRAALEAEAARWPLARLPAVVEIAVPWCPVSLYLVPGPAHVELLQGRGIDLARVWTGAEVLALLEAGVSPEDAQRVAEARVMTSATLDGVDREADL